MSPNAPSVKGVAVQIGENREGHELSKSEEGFTLSQLLTIKQAAERLACSEAAIRKWIYQGRLTPVKLGRLTRLRRADVERVASIGLPGRSCSKEAA
jgi:excisionase family DNA binding protein